MKKAEISFYRKFSFKEYVLALKYFMKNKEIPHVSGLCEGQFLNAQVSEEALSDLFRSAYRHDLFVKQGEDIHINGEVFTFMNAWTHSVNIVSLHKPSYGEMKLIAIARVKGFFLATVQNAEKDSIILMADSSIEKLYAQLEEYITAKDVNKAFKLKNINKTLQQNGVNKAYEVEHVFQLVALNVENVTGQKLDNEVMFNVGKTEYEVTRGAIEDSPIEKRNISQFKEELIRFIVENCPESDEGDADDKTQNRKKFEDSETYSPLSYQKLVHTEGFPLSLPGLLKMQAKSVGKSLFDWKRLLKVLAINAVVSVLVLIWNMYGMCYLNDTFRISERAFWGSATAYLFAGTIGGGSGVKGLSLFRNTIDTVLLTSSFYFLLSIAGKSFLHDIIHHDFHKNIKKLIAFPAQIKLYAGNVKKSFSFYLWVGIIVASVFGMILFNPFTVLLLALMLLVSCSKCESGMISPLIMMYRTSAGYKKVSAGKKKMPLYADVQLWLFAIGAGLLLYSGINLLVWGVFSYNIWARLIFTILLIVIALFRLGIIKISKPNQVASVILMVVAAGGLMWLAQSGIVLADDGGWSESGGSLWGLLHNSGFDTILGFSAVLATATFVALCTAGLALPIVAAGTALVGVGSLGWAGLTETGKETANDFMLGSYSPYGGDSKIATGLSIAVGLVPGVGEVFGIYSGVRDATYDFSNGNYASGIFDVVCAGLNLKGLSSGLKTAAKGVTNTVAKKVAGDEILGTLTSTWTQLDDAAKATLSSADNVAGAAANSADNVASAVAGSADNVAGAAANSADNVASAVAGSADDVIKMTPAQAQIWNSTLGTKLGKYVSTKYAKRQIVKQLFGEVTEQVKKETGDHIIGGIKDTVIQSLLGEGADFVDEKGAEIISGNMTIEDICGIVKDSTDEQTEGIVEIMNSGVISADDKVGNLMQEVNACISSNPSETITKDTLLEMISKFQ